MVEGGGSVASGATVWAMDDDEVVELLRSIRGTLWVLVLLVVVAIAVASGAI